MNDPKIPFYGRFIDDCFALVYANSEEEALASVQKVQFDDCRIEWNVSDHYQVFLDMTLYVDQHKSCSTCPTIKTCPIKKEFHGYLTILSTLKEEPLLVRCPV
jgi:hypothetical protein